MADRNSAAARRSSQPPQLAEAADGPRPGEETSASMGADGRELSVDMALRDGPPFCLIDPSGRVLYANAAYRRIAEPLVAAGGWPAVPVPPAELRPLLAPGRSATRDMPLGMPERPFRVHHAGVFDVAANLVAVGITLQPLDGDERLRQRLRDVQSRLDDLTRL